MAMKGKSPIQKVQRVLEVHIKLQDVLLLRRQDCTVPACSSPSGESVRKLNMIMVSWLSLLYQGTKFTVHKYRGSGMLCLCSFFKLACLGGIFVTILHVSSPQSFHWARGEDSCLLSWFPVCQVTARNRCPAVLYIIHAEIHFSCWGLLKHRHCC